METSTVVIKVKYGDMLRRFNAQIVGEELHVNMDGLREKILSLFNFAHDTLLTLTYIDEDGDVVTLDDDDDLCDVVRQALNPLRITVKLNTQKNGRPYARSSGSSTPLRSPRVQLPFQNLNSNVSETLKSVPEPLRETVMKHLTELASKVSSSAPGITEAVDHFSKMGLSYLNQLSESQSGVQSNTQSETPESTPATQDLDSSNVDQSTLKVQPNTRSKERSLKTHEDLDKFKPETTEENSKFKLGNVTRGSIEASSSKDPGLKAVTTDVGSKLADMDLKPSAVPDSYFSQGKCLAETFGSDSSEKASLTSSNFLHGANNVPIEQKLHKSSQPYLVPKLANASTSYPGFVLQNYPDGHIKYVLNNVGSKSADMDPKPSAVPASSFSQEKCLAETFGCYSSEKASLTSSNLLHVANNVPIEQKLHKSSQPYLVPKPANASTSYPGSVSQNYPDGPVKYVLNNGFSPVNPSLAMPQSPSLVMTANLSPFGVPVGNDATILPHPVSQRSSSQNDGTRSIFHRGVRCDGCGVYPITGPRFKSKVREDYDLCSICFTEMGNDTDYFRMDRPVAYRHPLKPLLFNGLHGPHAREWGATLPQSIKGCKVKPPAPKFDSHLIEDVNIVDGTMVAPLTPFTKIWRMRNNGTIVWPQRTQLIWIGGDKLNNGFAIEVEIPAAGLPVDQEIDVAVDFIAPELPGRYISYWRLASPSGQKFGQRVWVLIQVDASAKELPHESVCGLNLNLPPPSNGHPEHDNSDHTVESGEPVVGVQPNNEHEMIFPINDSLLVGSGASSSVPSAPPSSVQYPIIDLSEVAPAFVSQVPAVPAVLPPLANTQASVQAVSEKNEVEEKLLKELEAMGFKQVDLNREILRMNGYDLEQSVDDLCGVTERDPMLEELRDMGFHDTEMNKKLLKKNNGSIKRVVMDLISGEY